MLSALFSPRGLHVQGYLSHKKHPPPQDHQKSLGIGLLQCPTGGVSYERGTHEQSEDAHAAFEHYLFESLTVNPSSRPA